MVDTSIKQRLLTVATGTDMVRLSYGEAVRAALLIGVYEGAWDEDTVVAALRWWTELRSVLADRPGWQFTLRDYEPAWIWEGQCDDFMAVTVSTDHAGRIRYEVDISRDGHESAVVCPALSDLEALLVNTPS
ncbi:hypothetical protein ACF1GT_25715 [Streptomyces sp. NPDC014636]|uniref:hypothetical protein n=1 Tax=Streptomyces sp. NPDC014636 TaxID=3364876 RepID=UPI0036F4BD58